MKQILQNLGTGETELAEVPVPVVRSRHLLIRSEASLVSLGTERMLVEFGKANLLEKARRQPDKVRQVLQKIRTDGLFNTLETVRAKLNQPLPLGYCNAGQVIAVGDDVAGFKVGDRVVSNGPHAEVVCVPRNLCAKIPDEVTAEEAAFAVVGAIALHGVRLAQPGVGETVAVLGLGLIGLLAVQILKASGCKVIGADFDPSRCALAQEFGAEALDLSSAIDPGSAVRALTRGQGADAVLIAASTKSSDPVNQAAQMCRKRGRVIQIGVTGLTLNRADFYEKEISFQVSCSYGPGRYDPVYEIDGHDYPLGYVRWTEQRNFEAMLDLLAAKSVQTGRLISHRFSFDAALDGYRLVAEGGGLGIVLEYATRAGPSLSTVAVSAPAAVTAKPSEVVVGLIGAGNFASQVLLPCLQRGGVTLQTVVSAQGVSAAQMAKRFGFRVAATTPSSVIDDPAINTVFVATRPDSHARLLLECLRAGKRVFVEKPLCIQRAELLAIRAWLQDHPEAWFMVGFNRRFAPAVTKLTKLLGQLRHPRNINIVVNAGHVPAESWIQQKAVNGPRFVSEGCHFVDLARALAGAPISDVEACQHGGEGDPNPDDKMTVLLRFANGSVATLNYLANGHRGFPKERIEVFCGGHVAVIDNFRRLQTYGWSASNGYPWSNQRKGHAEEVAEFLRRVRTGEAPPIPLDELLEVTDATLMAFEKASAH